MLSLQLEDQARAGQARAGQDREVSDRIGRSSAADDDPRAVREDAVSAARAGLADDRVVPVDDRVVPVDDKADLVDDQAARPLLK